MKKREVKDIVNLVEDILKEGEIIQKRDKKVEKGGKQSMRDEL